MGFALTGFARDCRVADPERFAGWCGELFALLSEVNAHTNLTRIATEPEFEIKHVADSLAIVKILPEIAERPWRVADVGCGAGFPSLVLAAAFPQLEVTAIDSTHKKVAFVAEAAQKLGLSNVTAVAGRAVELARKPEFQERFDLVTARAVAAVGKLFPECRRMIAPHGRMVFYKTPQQAAELDAMTGCRGFGWRVSPEFELPENSGARLFIVGERA